MKYLHQPRGFLCNFHVWRLQVYDNVGALFQELLLMNYQEQTIKFGEFTRFLTQFGVQYVIKVANFPDKWALILQKTKLYLYPWNMFYRRNIKTRNIMIIYIEILGWEEHSTCYQAGGFSYGIKSW